MAISTVTELKMFIDGQWVEASGGGWIDVHNPATGELVGRVSRRAPSRTSTGRSAPRAGPSTTVAGGA